jgi:hypothetical protein
MKTTYKLTDSLIGINKLGTYHGYMNPENYFDSYQINQDFEDGHFEYNSERFWELFDHDLYTDLIVKQIDNLSHNLASEINWFFGIDIIEQINCVGIDSPKYYNYRDDYYLLDFVVNDQFNSVLIDFAEKNQAEFNTFLKSNYSSCDGFISFTANNFESWLTGFNEDRDQEIGAILSYLINCNLDFDFIDHCLQNFEIYYWDCIK